MRVAGYLRVSTTEQAVEGVSLAAQRSKILTWAVANKHAVAVWHEDAGISASIPPDERAGFKKALHDLKTGVAAGLVAVSIDRLSRSVVDMLALCDRFAKEDWALVSLRESLDTKSPVGRLLVTMLAACAEFERGIGAERTREGLRELRRTNRPFSRICPWGFTYGADAEGRKLIDNPDERRYMEHAVAMIEMGMSQPEIAVDLNAQVGMHPRTGKPWDDYSVQTLVRALKRAGLISKRRVNAAAP